MNALRILFKTNRFNLSKVGEHFINPCCFGENLIHGVRKFGGTLSKTFGTGSGGC
jgi:hypothetical protein